MINHEDLLILIEDILRFPQTKICKHYVAASILSLLETRGFPVSTELAAAVVNGDDAAALSIIFDIENEHEAKPMKIWTMIITDGAQKTPDVYLFYNEEDVRMKELDELRAEYSYIKDQSLENLRNVHDRVTVKIWNYSIELKDVI